LGPTNGWKKEGKRKKKKKDDRLADGTNLCCGTRKAHRKRLGDGEFVEKNGQITGRTLLAPQSDAQRTGLTALRRI